MSEKRATVKNLRDEIASLKAALKRTYAEASEARRDLVATQAMGKDVMDKWWACAARTRAAEAQLAILTVHEIDRALALGAE